MREEEPKHKIGKKRGTKRGRKGGRTRIGFRARQSEKKKIPAYLMRGRGGLKKGLKKGKKKVVGKKSWHQASSPTKKKGKKSAIGANLTAKKRLKHKKKGGS